MIQNILNPKQIIDDKSKPIIVSPEENFKLFRLFHDKHSKEYNFPTLLFG
jgi:hypothetical protein